MVGRWACAGVVALFVGCGPGGATGEGDTTGGDDGSGGTSGSGYDGGSGGDDDGDGSDGGDADDGGSGDGSGGGGSGGGGSDDTTGTGDVCEGFRTPDDIGPAVTLGIENGGDADIFVTRGYDCDPEYIWSLSGPGGSIKWRLMSWDVSCEDAMSGNCWDGGGCWLDSVYRIAPGGVLSGTWSGTVYTLDELPEECLDSDCEASCQRGEQAPAATYTVRAHASDAVTCPYDPCECELEADGTCEIEDGVAAGTGVEASATLDYPSETSVTVVF